MSFAIIKRAMDEEGETGTVNRSAVKADLKINSSKELESAIAAIQEELSARKKPDHDIVALQLQHIKNELATSPIDFSLEHLELYQQYLSRLAPDALADEHRNTHEHLLLDVLARLKRHPLAKESRSGDVAGNEDDFSYLKIPTSRRRQTLVVLLCNLLTGPALIWSSLLLVWYLVPYSTYFVLLYAAWVTYDNMTRPMPAPGRVVQGWRHSGYYQLFRDYFPVRTVLANRPEKGKSNESEGAFEASGHYLFCYHPHGVISAGAFSSFATAATGFDELFPGLSCSMQTLSINFKFPVSRENLIALGAGDASKGCLLKALGGKPGSSIALVTGGAKESMFAHPGNSKVVLKDRAGFIKIALNAGASLVPVWGFGENNLFENLAVKSPSVRRCQRRLQKTISFAPLMMEGRGVFSYSGGMIPHRRPITAVVGDPIHTGKPDPNPSNERIAEVHKQYQEAVTKIFNSYKDIYDPKAEPLEFV